MRAAVFSEPGKPIEICDDVEIIEPRGGEVRVQVKYCGLCNSDLGVATGKAGLPGPIVLGHEAAGIVESVGPGVTELVPGDHVVLTPCPPCGRCYYCRREDYTLCVNSAGLHTGTLPDGAYSLFRGGEPVARGIGLGALAEMVVTPVSGAIKIDPSVPLETACVIGCGLQTGTGAVLNTAGVEEGATVLIMGAGGVGIAAVQGARLAGACKILVSDPNKARREAATQFGATHTIDPINEDLLSRVMELTDGIGMDYAFETAGVGQLLEQGIQVIRNGGTLVGVGVTPFDQGMEIPNVVTFTAGQKTFCGCMLGSVNALADIPRFIDLWQAGKMDLENMITSRRPLEEINEALDDLAAGRGLRTVLKI